MPGMRLGFVSPVAATVLATFFYLRHRDRIEPERRVPALAYALAVIVAAGIAGLAGMVWGVSLACPETGNLCGLFGVVATGPIAALLAAVLVELALSLVRLEPER